MPKDTIYQAGEYRIRKRFRNEENVRHKKDLPWSKAILDLDNKKLFSRTAWGWFRIISFYMVLYSLIAMVVAFWVLIFIYCLLHKDRPLWLKGSPGLSIVPGGESTIRFQADVHDEINDIADTIDKFMEKLKSSGGSTTVFADCNQDKAWGYNSRNPCVFVKLNKVYGFVADTYDAQSDLPDSRPSELTDIMNKYPGPGKIWLTCETKESTPVITYIPHPYYDTGSDMKGANRVVALQLSEVPPNEKFSVGCKVWAKNIGIDMEFRGKGHAEFSMYMKVKNDKVKV